MKFKHIADQVPFIITEGSLIERIHRDFDITMDPYIMNASLIYDSEGKAVLGSLYREYIDIGKSYNLPIIITTPTWRANRERVKQAGYSDTDDVNGDCFRFMSHMRDEYGAYSDHILVGGLIGCRGDAYKPQEPLSTEEAISFHRYQLKALAGAGVDFLLAETLPAADEAVGIARAMEEYGIPYVICFILRPDGTLLDGTPLHAIISRIDQEVKLKPYCYLGNCMHPTVFESAIAAQSSQSRLVTDRVIGLLGNTSAKSPEELDNLPYLDTEEPEVFAACMMNLHKRFGMKILGGCCGTDRGHIEGIAKQISEYTAG